MLTVIEIIDRIKFWRNADRLGIDFPLTYWKLYFKTTMRKLCEKKFKYFGTGAEFRPGAFAEACSKISIGNRVVIRPGVFLFADPVHGGGEIVIEDDVMIGPGVHIYTNNHNYADTSKSIYDQGYPTPTILNSVILRKGCWVGGGAILLAGVEIGENSVIGAGSVVSQSVPPRVVFMARPGAIVRKIDNNFI